MKEQGIRWAHCEDGIPERKFSKGRHTQCTLPQYEQVPTFSLQKLLNSPKSYYATTNNLCYPWVLNSFDWCSLSSSFFIWVLNRLYHSFQRLFFCFLPWAIFQWSTFVLHRHIFLIWFFLTKHGFWDQSRDQVTVKSYTVWPSICDWSHNVNNNMTVRLLIIKERVL